MAIKEKETFASVVRHLQLFDTDFRGMDLRGYEFTPFDISSGGRRYVYNFRDMSEAVCLSTGDFGGCDLRGATFRIPLKSDALKNADIRGTFFDVSKNGVNLINITEAGYRAVPADGWRYGHIVYADPPITDMEGAFTAYKICTPCAPKDVQTLDDLDERVLVTLTIPADARRMCYAHGKSRAEKAVVKRIESLTDPEKTYKKAYSIIYQREGFCYKLGRVAKALRYDPDTRRECGGGIHFFMHREDAINYAAQIVVKVTSI